MGHNPPSVSSLPTPFAPPQPLYTQCRRSSKVSLVSIAIVAPSFIRAALLFKGGIRCRCSFTPLRPLYPHDCTGSSSPDIAEPTRARPGALRRPSTATARPDVASAADSRVRERAKLCKGVVAPDRVGRRRRSRRRSPRIVRLRVGRRSDGGCGREPAKVAEGGGGGETGRVLGRVRRRRAPACWVRATTRRTRRRRLCAERQSREAGRDAAQSAGTAAERKLLGVLRLGGDGAGGLGRRGGVEEREDVGLRVSFWLLLLLRCGGRGGSSRWRRRCGVKVEVEERVLRGFGRCRSRAR